MRKEKNGNRYFSFSEFAKDVFNIPEKSTTKTDDDKVKDIRESFEKKHVCKVCNMPLTYVGGNVMCCKNPECGKQSFHLLSEKNKRTAIYLYGESGVRV